MGSPYTIFFGLNLFKVFTDAYTLVSEPIRRKMTELFYTWKQPSATGSALFEKEPMKKIETFLDQARKKYMENMKEEFPNRPIDIQAQARQFLGNNGLSQSNLLIQVDKLLNLTQQRRAADPSDSDAVKQIDILNQLKMVLGSQKLPDNILPDIQQKLIGFTNKEMERLSEKEKLRDPRFQNATIPKGPAAMAKPANPNPGKPVQFNRPNQALVPTGPASSPFTQQQFQQMANIMNSFSQTGNYNQQPGNSQYNLMNVLQQPSGYGIQQGMNQGFSQGSNQAPPQTAQQQQQPIISSSLINSLMTAGLLSGGNKGPAVNPLFADIELTSSSLQKPRPNLLRLLYEEMPKSCSTCGKRFPDTEEGRKNREAHLDWHFRVNKKLREENWTQMRCWYVTQDQWIKYRDEEEILGVGAGGDDQYNSDDNYSPESNMLGVSSSGRGSSGPNSGRAATGSGGSGSGAGSGPGTGPKKGGKIDYDLLQKKYVLVPSNKHLASLPCPICKEKFNSVWNDDEVEDWVWMNAVEVKNRIFHATCYAETEVTGGDLIKRILAQQDVGVGSNGGSRQSTPVAVSTQATAVKALPEPAPVATVADPLAALNGLDLAAILSTAKRKREDSDDYEPASATKKEKAGV